jgi:hypothetical protein
MASTLKAGVDPVTGEVQETPELRTAGLQQLRAAIAADQAKAPGWRSVREDDSFLLAFLRARKFEIPRVLPVVRSFSQFWYANPTLINGLCAEKVRRVYGLGFLRQLDTKDAQGNALCLLDISKVDYSQFTDFEQTQLSLYIMLHCFGDEEFQRKGLTIVEDFAGFSVMRMVSVTKKLKEPGQEQLMAFGMDTLPMRIRAIYVVRQPMWFSAFWGAVKWFFKKKLRDRLVLCGKDLAALHQSVPPASLPPQYGGTLDEAPGAWLEKRAAEEAATGMAGGFALPLRLDDPTGERRRAEAASGGGGGGGPATVQPLAGGSSGGALHLPPQEETAGEAFGIE